MDKLLRLFSNVIILCIFLLLGSLCYHNAPVYYCQQQDARSVPYRFVTVLTKTYMLDSETCSLDYREQNTSRDTPLNGSY